MGESWCLFAASNSTANAVLLALFSCIILEFFSCPEPFFFFAGVKIRLFFYSMLSSLFVWQYASLASFYLIFFFSYIILYIENFILFRD